MAGISRILVLNQRDSNNPRACHIYSCYEKWLQKYDGGQHNATTRSSKTSMITVALLPFHAAFFMAHFQQFSTGCKNPGQNNREIKTLSHKFGWEISPHIYIYFYIFFFLFLSLDLLLFRAGGVQCMVVKTGIISCSRLSGLIRVLFIRVNWYLKSFPHAVTRIFHP